MKKLLATISMSAVAAFVLASCGAGKAAQGVTKDKILVGNTAATTGLFASVGVPFNDGLQAVFKTWNDDHTQKIELVHYDDEFDGAKGLSFTRKLVEEDKVFALTGHFGTNTVAATVDYIKEVGVPMVYAATGINQLYQEHAVDNERAVMPLQPIYKTEGRVLLARALAADTDDIGLAGTKIGVISTTDDAGSGILEGIVRQAQETTAPIVYAETAATPGTNHTTAVNTLKNAQCDVVIIAANQAPFGEILNAMRDANYNAKVITSYVSADPGTLNNLILTGSITADRPVYTTAWLDIASNAILYAPQEDNVIGSILWTSYKALAASLGVPTLYDLGVPGYSAEYWEAAEAIAAYKLAVDPTDYTGAFTTSYNSYALAGYISGRMFLHGLERVEGTITWEKYIDAMESEIFDIPMGGTLDLADGQRLGVASLALNRADHAAGGVAGALVSIDAIRDLQDVWEAVPANLKK